MKIRNYRINSFRRELPGAVIAENIKFLTKWRKEMFRVKNKETGQEYIVYAVGNEYLTRFLIYKDGHWKWQSMDNFVPVDTN